MRNEAAPLLFSSIFATLLFFTGQIALLIYVVRKVNRRLREHAAALSTPPQVHGAYRNPYAPPIQEGVKDALVYYLLSFFCVPVGLIFGFKFLKEPHSAKVGRTCIFIAMGYLTFAVVAACSIVLAFAIYVYSRGGF